MFDREVYGGQLAPLFLLGALAGPLVALSALLWTLILAWRRRWKTAGLTAAIIPLAFVLSWTLLERGCVAQVVVADLSSPRNDHRARTIMRDAGATTSWGLAVEVGVPGWLGWEWKPVFRTYRDIPAEILWRDATTLVIRKHRSPNAKQLASEIDHVRVVFEECPAANPSSPWFGPYVNGC